MFRTYCPELTSLLRLTNHFCSLAPAEVDTTAARVYFAKVLQLKSYLLSSKPFDPHRLRCLEKTVQYLQPQWKFVTDRAPPFPKLHMLTHCVELATKVKYLGALSEQSIESQHALIRQSLLKHSNTVYDLLEHFRRILSTLVFNQHLHLEQLYKL